MWVKVLALFIGVCCANITPFSINVGEDVLDDLKTRLENTRLPDQVEGAGWDYGANLEYMKELLEHWKTKYDWRHQEKELNKMPQYRTKVADIELHFVHMPSKHPNAKPLILLHGWPGSFWECSKVAPRLVDPVAYGGSADDAFHLICPSLPGYGFSPAPKTPGFDQYEAAKVMVELMHILGYDKYYVQGGDWGAIVAALMTEIDTKNIIGYHTNFPIGSAPYTRGFKGILHAISTLVAPSLFLEGHELEFLKRQNSISEVLTQTGYFHLQATKPQTIGYALTDSPVGLAAYITEKFKEWSDSNGDVETRFTKDELLTNIMIYWTTKSITSSMRFYYELFNGPNKTMEQKLLGGLTVSVPTACSIFPRELFPAIKSFAAYFYPDLRDWSVHKKGGHFAAMEEPELLVKDIQNFRRIMEGRRKQEKKEL